MSHMILADGSSITLEDGGSLAHLVHMSPNEADARDTVGLITKRNLKHVEFWADPVDGTPAGEPYGIYEDLVIAAQPTRQNEVDEDGNPTGRIIVLISLREQTELEMRVNVLEESQAVQDGAIEDLGTVVSDLVEE